MNKKCNCSKDCKCGCQEGKPCTCKDKNCKCGCHEGKKCTCKDKKQQNSICFSIALVFIKSIIKYEKYNQLYLGGYMKDKYVGIAKVGEKGQIVIPKEARDMFNIKPGDTVVVLCDKEKGIGILKTDIIEENIDKMMPNNK